MSNMDISDFDNINPYVRMMKVKRTDSLSGKWRDIDYVFTYIEAGSGEFIIDGNKYMLYAGDIIIMPPYKTHIIISQGDEPLVQYIMHFDFFATEDRIRLPHKSASEGIQYILSEEEKIMQDVILIAEIPEAERSNIRRLFLNMQKEFEEKQRGSSLMLKAGCINLIVLTLRAYAESSIHKEKFSGQKTKSWIHIENAVRYINECNMESELSNEAIANAIGVSPNYLTKVFQEYLGMPLHKYILSMKIEKAQKQLLTGEKNITEAAEIAGFSSIHVFSKTFKKFIGVTPSEFLDQIVNKSEIREKAN